MDLQPVPLGSALVDIRMQVLQDPYMPSLCSQCLRTGDLVHKKRVGVSVLEFEGLGMYISLDKFQKASHIMALPETVQTDEKHQINFEKQTWLSLGSMTRPLEQW
jgi:hypothetical protein